MSDIINIPTVENSTLLAQNQLLTAQNEILQAQTEQLTTIARNLTSLIVSGITLKGTIGTGGTVTALPSTHGKGDAYIVIKAGTYAGASCAVGDVLVALGTSGTSANDWSRIAGFMASDGAAKYAIENYDGSSLLGTNQTIVSAFNALNSKLVKVTLTKTSAVSRGDGFLIYDPVKKSVRIYASYYNATAIPSNTVIFTIPSGYRPPANTSVPCFYQSTSGVSAYIAAVNANGNVVNSLGNTTLSGFIVGEYLLE